LTERGVDLPPAALSPLAPTSSKPGLALRVAVVGARRSRQGTGEFIARAFAKAGWKVESIVGTSEASCEEARRALKERHGIEARAYLDLPELLTTEEPDVVAIASPAEHHLVDLAAAAGFGCHVFCEKPLWWSDSLADPASFARLRSTAEDLVARIDANGRLLALNTQWPETLDAFRELHPHALDRPLESFEMWLSPIVTGRTAVVDSAPHVLSLVHAVAGEGTLGKVGPVTAPAKDALDLPFEYRHAKGVARVVLHVKQYPAPPRPAAYAVNGFRVDREIEAGYKQFFVAGAARVLVPDPLDACVARFVRAVEGGAKTHRFAIVEGMDHLARLVSAVAV
jgi:predicted dehydrogenase